MLIPATRYADPDAALIFLRETLGLQEHQVFRDESGAIVHAQMRLGTGIMMFGPEGHSDFDRFMTSPMAAGGCETTTIYAVLDDADAVRRVHDRVQANGARVVMPLEPQGHGGVSFSIADPEGHIWTFGDYDPAV